MNYWKRSETTFWEKVGEKKLFKKSFEKKMERMQKKKSLKPIPLSLRDRKRYIVFKLISPKSKFKAGDVRFALDKVLLHLFGEVGLAKMNYLFVEFNEKKSKGIIRTNHTSVEEMKSGILFLKEIQGVMTIPKLLTVSGSLKKAKQK